MWFVFLLIPGKKRMENEMRKKKKHHKNEEKERFVNRVSL